MKAGERIYNIINGKEVDRMPVIEWAPWWDLTIERWQKEGLSLKHGGSESVLAIQRHFGLDGCVQSYFPVRSKETPRAKAHGAGIIKTEEDYENIKQTMFKDPSIYLPKERLEWLKKTRDQGDVAHWFTVEGFFWYARELFGIEPHLYSFYDEPEFLNRMCEDYSEWLLKVFEFVGNTFKFDFMSFAEDMSYNNGPMLSKNLFDEFLAPYYKKVIPIIKKADIPVMLDSDGDITLAVDWYAEVGVDGMFPLERQAGVDVSLYIQKQPQMAFLGHYDKMIMHKGEAALRAEFERLMPSVKNGRFILGVDHQTPPGVSYDDYKLFVKLFKEYAVK